jgi:hypothetical protein
MITSGGMIWAGHVADMYGRIVCIILIRYIKERYILIYVDLDGKVLLKGTYRSRM